MIMLVIGDKWVKKCQRTLESGLWVTEGKRKRGVNEMGNELHIYGQKWWHDEVVILGTTQALKFIRDAINEALKQNIGESDPVMTNDGEGYTVRVVCTDDETLWPTYAKPYSDTDATGSNEGRIYP